MTGAELQEAWELSRPGPNPIDAWVLLLQWCIDYHHRPYAAARRPRWVSPQIAIAGAQMARRATQTHSGQHGDTPTILSPQIASQPEMES